ncbi:MAG: dephospho-CoA kinase [Mogibacterium sp.]|nr:dephospho-CoA kinase [Mogibacterium sp.]
MLTIAVTGGIGSGKTAVTDHLQALGYTVIDTDRMAHEMTAPGGKAIPYILEHFGPEYIREDGSMDRQRMRELVFHDPVKKELLEAGTTAVIREDVRDRLADANRAGEAIVFVAIPLLFEAGSSPEDRAYEEIWSVIADEKIRKERIRKRNGLPDDIIDRMIASQVSDDVRKAGSTRVIENNGTLDDLYKTVDRMLEEF